MDYVITGIGLYNGLGKNAKTSFKSLLEGKSTFIPVVWPEDNPTSFPQTYKTVPKTNAGIVAPPDDDECIDKFGRYWKHWDPVVKIGLISVEEALNDSGLTSKNVGVSFSTFAAGSQTRIEMMAAINNGKRFSPRKSLNIGNEHTAAQIAAIYNFNGPNFSVLSACATGLVSIDNAISYMKAYPEMDAMVVGASERSAEAIDMYWFTMLGALSPSGVSSPFDKARDGFVLGEGAATLIIEPLDKAVKRGAKIHAIIRGCGMITNFDSDTSPDPEGEGAYQCMLSACKNADIDPSLIDYVNAHATSTPAGDEIELKAINRLFDQNISVVSNKGQIGHTMSACGLIETIYTLQTMHSGTSPGNANLTDPISTSNLLLPTSKFDVDVKYAIKNSFGFGGRNASMILEKV